MTVRRAPDVITEITLEGPASQWAHPDGTPIRQAEWFDHFMLNALGLSRVEGVHARIGDEIMEIIRCVDIEEEKQDG